MKKLTNTFIFTFLFLSIHLFAQSQQAESTSKKYILQGVVSDDASGEPTPFALVALFQHGSFLKGTETNLDGSYSFTLDSLGFYDLEVSYVGYATLEINGIAILQTGPTIVDIQLSEGVRLASAVIAEYKEPIIKMSNTTSGGTVTAHQIRSLPTKNMSAIAATKSGMSVGARNEIKIRGSRTEGTHYYIDGVRVGVDGVAQSEINEVQVIVGGTDAKYEQAQEQSIINLFN